MAAEIFLDTAYVIALASTSDQHHSKALALAEQIEKSATRLIVTRPVMLEIGNALAKARYRQAAVDMLNALERDPTVSIIPLTEDLYAKGWLLFQSRVDKEWGLIDCVSFVVMNARGLTEALTTDVHFEQAGFRALLRD